MRQDILNFRARLAGCALSLRPSILVSMAIVERAFGGSKARKLRAVLPERPLKGEKVARTEVMYFVSIFYGVTMKCSRGTVDVQLEPESSTLLIGSLCGELGGDVPSP